MASRALLLLLAALAGCSSQRRFPAVAPLTRDTDLQSVNVRCFGRPTKHDPKHLTCAPREYLSPLVWDAVDNTTLRPLTQTLALRRSGEAVNVNSMDEVPDSSWFTNKVNVRPVSIEDVKRGACAEAQIIDGAAIEDGSWVIDAGKANGSTPGFRVNVPGKGKYLFKTDAQEAGAPSERSSASSTIGSRIYALLGFNTSCEQIVYVKASAFTLKDGLTYSDNLERTYPFDHDAVQKVFDGTAKRGQYMRFLASAWLPGHLVGPFQYHGTRPDDPNDVIVHEKRRDLRAGRLVAAWMNHFDSREQNSMDSWIADDPTGEADSSPGYVRHYYLDTSDALGAEWVWDYMSRRLGYSYVLDWGDVAYDFITFGIPLRRWETTKRVEGYEELGYFNAFEFEPEAWKGIYENPTFIEMSEHDAAWMARIMAHVTPEMVRALVETGEISRPALVDYLTDVMQQRLDRILARYFSKLSPIGDLKIDGNRLCGVDFARLRSAIPGATYRYSAQVRDDHHELRVSVGDAGGLCVELEHARRDDPYFIVRIDNGVTSGPLDAHLYDFGEHGFFLAGIERPDAR